MSDSDKPEKEIPFSQLQRPLSSGEKKRLQYTDNTSEKTTLAHGVEAMLAGLSEKQRQVIALRTGYEDGKEHTLRDIAATLGITYEGVRRLESRAIKKLLSPRAQPPAVRDWIEDKNFSEKVKEARKRTEDEEFQQQLNAELTGSLAASINAQRLHIHDILKQAPNYYRKREENEHVKILTEAVRTPDMATLAAALQKDNLKKLRNLPILRDADNRREVNDPIANLQALLQQFIERGGILPSRSGRSR